jgi:hypothetical protein
MSAMGYTHYWHRPRAIAEEAFRAIRTDFARLILPLADAGATLAGGLGKGVPEIDDDGIRFNGMHDCGHPKNEEISIPYPSEYAEGVGLSSSAVDETSEGLTTLLKHRCCNGNCDYETFSLTGPWTQSQAGSQTSKDSSESTSRPVFVLTTSP